MQSQHFWTLNSKLFAKMKLFAKNWFRLFIRSLCRQRKKCKKSRDTATLTTLFIFAVWRKIGPWYWSHVNQTVKKGKHCYIVAIKTLDWTALFNNVWLLFCVSVIQWIYCIILCMSYTKRMDLKLNFPIHTWDISYNIQKTWLFSKIEIFLYTKILLFNIRAYTANLSC